MKHLSMDSRHDIPEHLLFDILLWLPVTSLLRFKAVCKSWYTLIDSPIFISQHFDHNSGKDNLLGRLDTASEKCSKFCLLSGNKYAVYRSFDCGQHCPVPAGTMLSFSSNGIVCFIDYERNISLWNPSMKQWRSLSIPLVHWQAYYDSFFGFGFNVKSSDHNIVITTLIKNTSNNLVNIYSLKADSWRTMRKDFAIPSRFYKTHKDFKSHTHHITKDGTCFWIAHSKGDGDTDGNVILSFDLNDERYETMPLPVGKVPYVTAIDFLGDKLAYIHRLDRHPGINCYIEIWVLHEYGVKESWSKAWKIGPGYTFLFPLHFISNGEFLLVTNTINFRKNSKIFGSYSLSTEENEYNGLHQPNLRFSWAVRYTESLFPVKRVNDAHQQGGLADATECSPV